MYWDERLTRKRLDDIAVAMTQLASSHNCIGIADEGTMHISKAA